MTALLAVEGLERPDALGWLSVITDDQLSAATVDSNSASERLVVASSAAASRSPGDVTRGQESQVTGAQTTSQPPKQVYVLLFT